MLNFYITVINNKNLSEGLMQMIYKQENNKYFFELEEEEYDLLIHELKWQKIEFTVSKL